MEETELSPLGGPLALVWKNVSVTAGDRVLLKQLSGSVSGQFLGIMGSTGSGKSTFLNVLAKRIRGVKVEGEILINNEPVTPAMLKAVSGYVMQDDMLFASLSVEETLSYAASLRLPNSFTSKERQDRVEEVIKLLGLQNCRNTPIGGPIQRGISGGEKKRVCVAVELLNRPQLLFLDEPTSGLDSANALTLCSALKELTKSLKCTVVCTLHQPQTKIFSLFDQVLLLNEGEMIYSGPVGDVGDIYAKAGFPMPDNVNPADHMLDVITPTSAADKDQVSEAQVKIKEVILERCSYADDDNSSEYSGTDANTSRINYWKQFSILFVRSMKDQIRNRRLIVTQLVQNMLMSILVGFVYFQIGDGQDSVDTRQSVLFFCVINQGLFSALMIVNSFPDERAITLRERAAGSYYVSAYFLAKSISEILITAIYPLVFSIIAYFLIGLQPNAGKFFIFASFLCLCCLASTSLALFISAVCHTTLMSLTILPFLLELARLFGGFYLSPKNLPIYFIWLDALSFVKYSYIGISLNELHGLVFSCTDDELTSGTCTVTSGQDVIDDLGMDKFGMGWCYFSLFVLIGAFRVGTYLALRFLK